LLAIVYQIVITVRVIPGYLLDYYFDLIGH
jgi:hypothetical protein